MLAIAVYSLVSKEFCSIHLVAEQASFNKKENKFDTDFLHYLWFGEFSN